MVKRFWAIFLVLPVLLVLNWHWHHLAYPRDDEGAYLENSQISYRAFAYQGITEGLYKLYFSRSFKPIIHPTFAVPAIAISHGDIRQAKRIVCLTFYLLLIFILLKIFEFDFAMTFFIVSLPLAFRSAQEFGTEIPFLVAGLFCYHRTIKIFSQWDLRNSILWGLSMALCICIRPAESLIILIPTTILFIGKNRAHVHFTDYFALTFQLILFVLLGIYQISICSHGPCHPEQHTAYVAMSALPLALFLFAEKIKLNKKIWAINFFSLGLFLLWVGPYLNSLYRWIYDSSFGAMAVLSGHREGISFFKFFGQILHSQLGILGLFILITSMASLAIKRDNLRVYIAVTILSLLPLVMGSLSSNGDPRYYFLGSTLLLVNALIQIKKSIRFPTFISIVLVIIGFFQCVYFYNQSFSKNLNMEAFQHKFFSFSFLEAIPNASAVETMVEYSQKFLPLDQETSLCILQMPNFKLTDWALDPWSLTLAAYQRNLQWRISRPFPHEFSTTEERYKNIVINRCKYVVVASLEYMEAPIVHFMSDVGEKLIGFWKNNQLAANNWEYLDKFTYTARDGSTAEAILLKNLW